VFIRRKNPFGLIVAFDANSVANGSLYWDDGEAIGTPFSILFVTYL